MVKDNWGYEKMGSLNFFYNDLMRYAPVPGNKLIEQLMKSLSNVYKDYELYKDGYIPKEKYEETERIFMDQWMEDF